jgi:Bacterial SCP ortholog
MPKPSPERLRAALDAQLADLDVEPYDGPDTPERLKAAALDAVLLAYDQGLAPDRRALGVAVRHLLDLLATTAPGRSVEVRVPPFGAVQCVPGPRHTRGTPANVIETDAATWISLATGRLTWAEATAAGRISASGLRADLSGLLPIGSAEPA